MTTKGETVRMILDLTDEPGIKTLGEYDLARLLRPAAEEVE